MLKLKTLKFKNIGRFVEEQTIDLANLGSLIQVDAQNNLTGGSSGSGKSTVFNALDWLLGLSDLSTGVLQSRLTKETISVTGEFDWDGHSVTIHRAKKLSVTVDGIETVGSSKLAEEELDKILGLPRHLFSVLLHRRQGETGFFLKMTPSKMNEFLTDCLGLSTVNSKIDLIDAKIKIYTIDRAKAESDLQSAQAALEATKSAIASLGEEPKTDVTETNLTLLKMAFEGAESELYREKTARTLEKGLLEQKKPILTAISFDFTQLNSLNDSVSEVKAQINAELDKERARQTEVRNLAAALKLEVNNKISTLRLEHQKKIAEAKTSIFNLSGMVSTGRTAKEKAIQLASRIKTLRDGSCHVCLQSWKTDENKTEEEKLLKELAECKIDMDASVFAANELEEMKAALITLNDQVNAEIAALNDQLASETAILTEQAKPQVYPVLIELNTKLREVTKLRLEEKEKEDLHNKEQNLKNQALMQVFYEEQKALNEKHQTELAGMVKYIAEAKAKYEQAEQALKAHKESLARYSSTLGSLKAKETDINQKVVHMNQKLATITEDLELAEEAKKCLKSYLSCSFDGSLISISESATRILRSVPTMANATIRLEGTKETAKGAIKDEVTACLDNDGELDIPIKSLSGGERSAVDLAIDLAVIELIEDRTNKGIDLLLLDEIFNGFDSLGIEHALEMLKTFGANKKLLLVEHDGIAKEYIQDRITVIRDGETSYLK